MTPTLTEQRSVLEFLADPNRAQELLALMKQAEAVQQKAIAAKIEADQAMKAAADELTKAREVQDINTKKSARLAVLTQELAAAGEAMKAAKADDVARLAEWEARLKAQADAQAEIQAALDRKTNDLAAEWQAFQTERQSAAETIAKAAAIRAAMG